MLDLDLTATLALAVLILLAAAVYAAVGHGGASAYLAAMALFGLPPAFMKPAALSMNIAVTALVFWRLHKAGHFDPRLFLPFALASIPLAFLGGMQELNEPLYRLIVAFALAVAATRLFWRPQDLAATGRPPIALALAIGGVMGYLSGLTGVGGGIFLSPVVLLLRWTDMRGSAALAAAFIFVNSVAGLAGFMASGGAIPSAAPGLVTVALIGGAVGAELAVRRLAPQRLRQLLGVVLIIAAGKMAWLALAAL